MLVPMSSQLPESRTRKKNWRAKQSDSRSTTRKRLVLGKRWSRWIALKVQVTRRNKMMIWGVKTRLKVDQGIRKHC